VSPFDTVRRDVVAPLSKMVGDGRALPSVGNASGAGLGVVCGDRVELRFGSMQETIRGAALLHDGTDVRSG
jgi:hypothetical protein